MTRVLIAGGYGVVGGWIARHIRAAGYDVELVLAGRAPAAGAMLAKELDASVAQLDSDDAVRDLAAIGSVDLVISALQDPDDKLLVAALRAGSGHLGIVRKVDNLGPTAMAASILAQRPSLVAGHWQAGTMSYVALAAARGFKTVDGIAIAALFDLADASGPMAHSDSQAFFTKALMRQDGAWVRADQSDNLRTVERHGLPSFQAQPMGVLDVAGLEAMTGAQDVRFDIGVGTSIGTASGGPASHDILIDMQGTDDEGRRHGLRIQLSDPKGQAHLTALGALIGAERLLGLDGSPPPAAGLHFPERIIDPVRAVERLKQFGLRIETHPGGAPA